MINIFENYSRKVVGQTSLFVSFDYDPKIIEIIKQANSYVYDDTTKTWEMPLNNLSYLIDNLTSIDDINLDFLPVEKEEELPLVVDYKLKPFNYQLEGIKWLINHENGLLLDVPGLGKTAQVIYAAEELKAQKNIEHCLIICGINTLKNNWKREIQKFSNLDCIIIGEKINSKGKISYASVKDRAEQLYQPIKEFFVILNVESLRDSTVVDAIKSSHNSFDMIVIDEIHKLKGATTSQQSKNLLKLVKVGKYHYGLTGTLLVNSPLDAYIPLKFIRRERANFTNFKKFYCNINFVFGHQQIVGYKNVDLLKEEIGQCSLRRDKSLLDLPEKIIVPEFLDMPDSQLEFYENLQKGLVGEADRVNIKNTSLLGLITRLREATSCPSVLSSKNISNVKIERACELVEEITSNGEKVVIFSVFKEPLYLLNKILGKDSLLCTGDQSEQELSDNIHKFQNDNKYKVMLCTSSKMGTGITLTAASYEIHLDTSWTYAEFEQCCDRCHRIGTEKTVIIYDLIARKTIDERVYNLINTKKEISDYIIDNKYNESEELRYLLGLS